MSQDINPAQSLERRLGQALSALGRGQVRLDELDAVDRCRSSTGGGDNLRAAGQETLDGGAARALGATADKHAFPSKLGRINFNGHAVISSVLMRLFSSVKRYVKRIGLP